MLLLEVEGNVCMLLILKSETNDVTLFVFYGMLLPETFPQTGNSFVFLDWRCFGESGYTVCICKIH